MFDHLLTLSMLQVQLLIATIFYFMITAPVVTARLARAAEK